jgi:hypothetical protein
MQFSSAEVEQIARSLLGEPNRALSNKHELRYGTHGSLSIDLKKCVWFDHELEEGGDTFELIRRETGGSDREVIEWLERNGLKEAAFNGHRDGNGADIPYDAEQDPFKNSVKFKREDKQFRIVQTWAYVDENGDELFEVCRLENGDIGEDEKPVKKYVQRHKDSSGQYIYSIKGIRQVPYRLPEIIESIAQEKTIFITEGEKCADAVVALGAPATCNAMGAGKWPDELTPHFAGAEVIILPDNDKIGREHANLVASKLQGTAKQIRIFSNCRICQLKAMSPIGSRPAAH